MDYFLRRLTLLICLHVLVPGLASADPGKELFDKQCASCHTIGGGDSGGPDLKGVAGRRAADWLVRVIVEPDKLSAGKDPVQLELVKQYGYEMPNLGISRDDARKIIAYLGGGAPAAATATTPKTAGTPPKEPSPTVSTEKSAAPAEQPLVIKEKIVVTPQLLAQGRALFTGAQPFAKGGAPCLSCHAFRYPGIESGNLAADLTGLYERMGEQGIRGVLKSLKFPIMKKIYADRPLTDEEITALAAFAEDAATRKESPGGSVYPAAGAGLFVCFIIGLTLYKRRIR
jgi:mono/diheme cytochrome c family protein